MGLLDGVRHGPLHGPRTPEKLRKELRKALPTARAFVCLIQHQDHSISLFSEVEACKENDVRDDVLMKTRDFAESAGDLMQRIVDENIQKKKVLEFKQKRSEELKGEIKNDS